jgi:MOSC domain-containing protein YiiM
LNTGGHGAQPCAGAYLAVVTKGVIRVGDQVTIGP